MGSKYCLSNNYHHLDNFEASEWNECDFFVKYFVAIIIICAFEHCAVVESNIISRKKSILWIFVVVHVVNIRRRVQYILLARRRCLRIQKKFQIDGLRLHWYDMSHTYLHEIFSFDHTNRNIAFHHSFSVILMGFIFAYFQLNFWKLLSRSAAFCQKSQNQRER